MSTDDCRPFLLACLLLVAFSSSALCKLPRKCIVENSRKKECGYPGIPEDYCLASGCCYANITKDLPWCYKANTDKFLSTTALVLLARDGVPFDVLASLYADYVPGAEWLMAFKNGKVDPLRLLQLMPGFNITIDPVLADFAAGKSPWKRLLRRLAAMRGLDPYYLELLLGGETEAVLKHLVILSYVKNNYTVVPVHVLNAFFSGHQLRGTYMIHHFVDILFHDGDPFRTALFRALESGKMVEAIQWAYLGSLRDQFPQEAFYPPKAGVFASILEEAERNKNGPSKILPSTLEAIKNGKLIPQTPVKKTFREIFGKQAHEYVCYTHAEYLETGCRELRGRYIVTSADCDKAGCCRRKKIVSENGVNVTREFCFENILGRVGLMLSGSEQNEDYTRFILTASKFYKPKFIPWVPNTNLPKQYTRFVSSGSTNLFAHHHPTIIPIKASKRRPNFVWKPHGPTAFPFPTQVPRNFLVPTDESLIESFRSEKEGPEPKAVRNKVTLGAFKGSCRNVCEKDRYQCIDNYQALSRGGRDVCLNHGCCYQPDWKNLSIPVCFRRITYGQCYLVEPEEREECGHPGISKEDCLKNVQCCYDSAVSVQSMRDQVPWCYYKKHAPVREDQRCTRNIPYENRRGCFLNYHFNFMVSQNSCEEVEGCCYEKVKVSWFDRAIGLKKQPPFCYKGLEFDLRPTEARPPPPPTKLVCEDHNSLLPHLRTRCSKIPMNWFSCVSAGCCFAPVGRNGQFEWCYKKTRVPA